jgi:hypothetical protein
MNRNQKVTDYINLATPKQLETLESLRSFIHQTIAGTTEDFKWGMPIFKKNKTFTYLKFSDKYVTLGFYNIDRIKDDKNILEGDGKTMRHVKIRKTEDIDFPLFSEWFKATAD